MAGVTGVIEIKGDLLESNEPLLAHQCNCLTFGALGFAKALFDKYPYSNIYHIHPRCPGELYVAYPKATSGPIVVGMLAQFRPGRPTLTETAQNRIEWFGQCLESLGIFMRDHKYTTVAMPLGIGCGLAGGNWEIYREMINKFAYKYEVSVRLYLKEQVRGTK